MLGFIAGALTLAAGIVGFSFAREYTIRRLRFVDGARSPAWPWIVGLVAAVVTAPLALLPLVTTGTAIIFGLGTGLGTASAVKTLKRGGS